ncbi:MAG: hypothetical protein WDZ85_02105 [Candidatus Paceibacterota bacterium]
MSRYLFLVVIVLCLVGLSGCPLDPYTATLRVKNISSHYLVEVNVVSSSSTTWGTNRLPATLAPNSYYDVRGLPPGWYDLRVVSFTGDWSARFDVYLEAGTTREWTIFDAKSLELSDELSTPETALVN